MHTYILESFDEFTYRLESFPFLWETYIYIYTHISESFDVYSRRL